MRMLVVDDEKIIRQGIVRGHDWQSEGIDDVIEARNGIEALQLAEQCFPEIIVTDIRMPKMTGLEFSKKLIEQQPNTKIIMLSGYDDFEYAQQAIQFGVMEYLLKPAKIENILNSVRKAKGKISIENQRKIKEEMLERQLGDNLPLIKNKYLNDLVNGTIGETQQLEENLKFLKIDIPLEHFIVGVFSIDSLNDAQGWQGVKDYELVKFAIMNILNELVQREYRGVVFEDYSNQIVMMIHLGQLADRKHSKLAIIQFTEKCRQCIEDNLGLTITVGIGRYCSHFSQLNISYKEAVAAVRHKLIIGKNKVIHIDDLQYLNASQYYYPKNIEEKLMVGVEMGDESTVKACLKEFFEILRNNNICSLSYTQNSCMGLLFILSRKLMELGISVDEQQPETRKYWNDELEKLETLDEIENFMISMFQQAVESIVENCHRGNRGIITIAKKYLNDHIGGDLSLKTVSEVVHMSPNYFTYLFKQEVGENFSDYVSGLRLEKAKELFRDRDLKTYEVAEKVGYQDSRYFSQFFKKYTGMTPSEFKQTV